MRVTQVGLWTTLMVTMLAASSPPQDPGVRPGAAAGGMLPELSAEQQEFFAQGQQAFEEPEALRDGLGPRFNLESCGGCHAFPALGGTSPAINPQVDSATAGGAQNTVPLFITRDGPIREVRFPSDGQVHALYVISGRRDETGDARSCDIHQESFAHTANLRFRIPTPVFGLGLMEQIPDAEIRANRDADADAKEQLGIRGDVQTQGNGESLGRFGWKAQHANVETFAAEAYNVEMGITSALFPTERDTTADCQYAPVPNSVPEGTAPSDVALFAAFMRGLAPPKTSRRSPGGAASITHGRRVFTDIGCAFCHTPLLAEVPLYSDLLLHRMGTVLADDITQGDAGPDHFRTAPLWGLGQRLFFLHDGRTQDLLQAIQAHASPDSEASGVMANFDQLDTHSMQDLLNFLRSL